MGPGNMCEKATQGTWCSLQSENHCIWTPRKGLERLLLTMGAMSIAKLLYCDFINILIDIFLIFKGSEKIFKYQKSNDINLQRYIKISTKYLTS